MSDSNQQRVRKLPDQELYAELDSTGIDRPEHRNALHVLEDRHQRKNQEKMSQLIKVIEEAATSSDGLGRKLLYLNVILTIATVIGAAATVVMAWPK